MQIPEDVESLAALFKRLGARNAEAWARSQVDEGINQLGRFLFLRAAWRTVINDGDVSWIQDCVARSKRDPNAPGAAAGAALERLLATGASRDDLATVARVMQWQTLFGLCHLLSDPGVLEEEVKDYAWYLMGADMESDEQLGSIDGLHESVLETDPTGREMRPVGSILSPRK
jgi:hypothetical protein